MSLEEYNLFVKSDSPPNGWVIFSWEIYSEKIYFSEEMWFPNEKVAKAYFAAHGITNFYQETV